MRKLLNTLYITDETAYLSLDGETIICKSDDKEKFRIPFANIESIFCFSFLGCSPALMGKCAKENVGLNFLTPYGRFLARVTGEVKGNVFLRKKQISLFDSNEVCLIRNCIAAKCANAAFLLKRSMRDYPELDKDMTLTECVNRQKIAATRVYEENDKDVLRGIEGDAAKAYFDVYPKLILQQCQDFAMTGRTKRPPLDRVNAMLSFLYTIYTCDFAAALEGVGLDPYIGFFHTLRPGRCSLACDLVEEARCIIERTVLSLINLRQIRAEDFTVEVSGAVLLNDEGRKKVLTKWQEKKRTNLYHPYLKQKIPYGLLPFIQASLLAKYVRGEIGEYPPFLCQIP